MIYDALAMRFRELKLRRDPACPVCGDNPTITAPIDYEEFCGVPGHDRTTSTATSTRNTMANGEISVEELARIRQSNEPHTLIDVREPSEYATANIGGTLIPLGDLPTRAGEIPREGPVYVHCKLGGRSGQAVEFLKSIGYTNVQNVAGGITAWSERVDRSVPVY